MFKNLRKAKYGIIDSQIQLLHINLTLSVKLSTASLKYRREPLSHYGFHSHQSRCNYVSRWHQSVEFCAGHRNRTGNIEILLIYQNSKGYTFRSSNLSF